MGGGVRGPCLAVLSDPPASRGRNSRGKPGCVRCERPLGHPAPVYPRAREAGSLGVVGPAQDALAGPGAATQRRSGGQRAQTSTSIEVGLDPKCPEAKTGQGLGASGRWEQEAKTRPWRVSREKAPRKRGSLASSRQRLGCARGGRWRPGSALRAGKNRAQPGWRRSRPVPGGCDLRHSPPLGLRPHLARPPSTTTAIPSSAHRAPLPLTSPASCLLANLCLDYSAQPCPPPPRHAF